MTKDTLCCTSWSITLRPDARGKMALALENMQTGKIPWLSEGNGLLNGAVDVEFFRSGRSLNIGERARISSDDYWKVSLVDLLDVPDLKIVGDHIGPNKPAELKLYTAEQKNVWCAVEKRFMTERLGRAPTEDEFFQEYYINHHNTERFRVCFILTHPNCVTLSEVYNGLSDSDRSKIISFYNLARIISGRDYVKELGL